MFRLRTVLALVALMAALTVIAADVQARVGGGSSGGSRGSRTFSAPPVTRTAPNAASPVQRTITQPTAPSVAGQAAGTGAANAARPGLFGGGLLGGLAAGFIGAGLFGMLFGHGFMGGMGGFASLLGLVIQIALLVIVARLVIGWFSRRSQPAFAGAGAAGGAPKGMERGMLGGMFGGGGGAAPQGEPLDIGKADYDAFEALLGETQAAYSNEDIGALRAKVTPEMLSYFSEDLTANASRGVVNRVSDVKLLQGDLAEAWREGAADYATVAMRFTLVDRMVERASGHTVEGGDAPQEVTELWTFMRTRGGGWLLSAIQQA